MSTFESAKFLSLVEGDRNLAIELINLFLADSVQLQLELKEAVNKGHSSAIERLAHRLKGNAKTFFADKAANLALKLEEFGRTNQLASALPTFIEFEAAITELKNSLVKFRDELAKK